MAHKGSGLSQTCRVQGQARRTPPLSYQSKDQFSASKRDLKSCLLLKSSVLVAKVGKCGGVGRVAAFWTVASYICRRGDKGVNLFVLSPL